MKVQEFIEIMNSDKTKMLKPEQYQSKIKKTLEVKEYIGIKEKKQLVQDIIDECIIYTDGVFKFDESEKYIMFIMKAVEAYTNLELSNDVEEDYDALSYEKLLPAIIDTFKQEYDDVNVLLQMKCDFILSNNTIEAQLGAFLSDISSKIDVFANALVEKVEGLDFNNLPVDVEDLSKLMNLLNNQK